MSNFAGYLQLRRAVFEHVRDGRLSHMEALAYIYMASQADTRTGVWYGSSGALAGELCCSERQARSLLESLSIKTYIKRFPVPGRHCCYPILINKYQVTDGEHKGERLNANTSESWNLLAFEKISDSRDHNVKQSVDHTVELTASQRKTENRQERNEAPSASAQSPSQDAIALASLLKQRILENNPTARITQPQEATWAREADLMMHRDSRAEVQIRELIEWSQRDSFWKTVILSMGNLRDKFDRLTLKRNETGGNNGAKSGHSPRGAVAPESGKYYNVPVQRVKNSAE
jgi:hypothetical protein